MPIVLALVWLTSVAVAGPLALAVSVVGEVSVEHPPAPPIPLSSFARVVLDDTLQVPAGGSVQLVFAASGRRETWTGPATVHVGPGRGDGPGSVAIVDLGGDVGVGVHTLAVVLDQAERERGGATLVRGDGAATPLDALQQEGLDAARATYRRLADARAAPDDVTPELVLGAALITYAQVEEACAVLRRATVACRECRAPVALLDGIGRAGCP